LTEKLEMHRVAAKFVPRLLTDEQKANRVTVSQELFERSNADENFLKNVITGDETWVYGCDIETKAQLLQWVGKSSLRPKKARQSRSNTKVLLIVLFDGKGVVHHDFVPRGQTPHLLTCCSSSVNFWRSTRRLSSPNRHTLQIWPLQTFFFVP
jgi:hypothetical protein